MRINRHLKTVVTLTALTTVGALAACTPSSYGRHSESRAAVSATWDSGPLDRDYGREHAELEARHNREIANPEHGESKYDMDKRQSNENNNLEVRYKQGKDSHASVLPPS